MKNSIKADLKTWIYSRYFLIPLLTFISIFAFSTYGSYRGFSVENSFFLIEEKHSIEEGNHDEFITALTNPSAKTVYNSEYLIRDLEYARSNLHAISPEHVVSYCIETGFFFFPFMLTLFGAMAVKKDMANNILRLRIIREGRWNYFFGKQVVLFVLILACVIIGMISDAVISYFMHENAIKKDVFHLININNGVYPNMGNKPIHIAFFIFYIFLFVEIGFCLGVIFKSALIPLGVITAFFYVIPMFKYSPLNALTNVICRMCDFQGVVHFTYNEISVWSVLLIISLLLIIPLTVSIFVFRKRSAYR